jgi:hypothetical protein
MWCWRRIEKISWTDREMKKYYSNFRGEKHPTNNKIGKANWIVCIGIAF